MTTTICWGVVLVLGPLLPAQSSDTPQTRPLVPAILPFDTAWTIPKIDLPGRVALVATTDHVIAASKQGPITAFDPASGRVEWTMANASSEIAPSAGDGLIFVVANGRLRALAENSGDVRWEETEAAIAPETPVWRAGWLIASTGHGVRAYRAIDGTFMWQHDFGRAIVGSLAIDGDLLFAPLADRTVSAVEVPTGKPQWTTTIDVEPAGLLAAHDRIYLSGDTVLNCLRQKDGRPLWAWQARTKIVGRPVTDERSVYFVGLDNMLRALERYGGNLRWDQPLTSRPATGPAVSSGRVFVPLTSGEVDLFVAETGARAGRLASAPDASRAALLEAVVVSGDGRIVRLTTASGEIRTLTAYVSATLPVITGISEPGTPLDFFAPRLPRVRQ